ncbi:Fructose import ATP-binding protein FrcA [subsurface metagenome]
MSTPLVKMKNVHKWFGTVHALRGVNIHVGYSEILGLIGDNGAGKSTLIKILVGLYPPSKGSVFFDGEKVNFSSPRDARDSGIETIYQEQALADDLSVSRNIFLGKELLKSLGPIKLLDDKKMKEESRELLESLHLHIPSMDQKTMYCSGGEKQGIAIARAIYFQAKLVILDEPTTALGVKGAQRVLELVKELKSKKISCLFITHDLPRIYSIADRLVVLVRGKVVKDVKKKNTSVNELIKFMT